MLFVGIDIAKNKHDMAVIDSNGNVILKHMKFSNNKQGFDKMHSKIMELVEDSQSLMLLASDFKGFRPPKVRLYSYYIRKL